MIKRGAEVEGARFGTPSQVHRLRLGHAGHSAFHSGHDSPGFTARGRMEVGHGLAAHREHRAGDRTVAVVHGAADLRPQSLYLIGGQNPLRDRRRGTTAE